MALRDMSEGKLILLTIGGAILFAIPCWGYFYFVYRDYTAATERFATADKQNKDLEDQKKDMTKKASRITTAEQNYDIIKRMLPEKDDTAKFFAQDWPNLLSKNRFEMQTLTIKDKPEKEKLKDAKLNLQVWYKEYDIRISGTYKNMIQLLKEIEEGRESTGEAGDNSTYRLYKVKDFEFSPSADKTLDPDLKHSARIVLDAYYIDDKAK